MTNEDRMIKVLNWDARPLVWDKAPMQRLVKIQAQYTYQKCPWMSLDCACYGVI